MKEIKFADRSSIEFVEEGSKLAPKFNRDGVIPVVVTESKSDLVLMLGYMNKEALDKINPNQRGSLLEQKQRGFMEKR